MNLGLAIKTSHEKGSHLQLLHQPELDLVLLASREAPSDRVLDLAQGCLAKCSNEEHFRNHCAKHMTLPLVLSSLKRLGVPGGPFPRHLRKALAMLEREQACNWLFRRPKLEQVLTEVRNVFKSAQVSFIIMRGLPFAATYYADPLNRVTSDIDVLVPEQFQETARACLLDAGFTDVIQSSPERQAYALMMGQTEMAHRTLGVWVDVNWRLTGNCGIGPVPSEMSGMWARCKHVNEYESRLAPEDELAELIRHTCHGHDFETGLIKTCVDVAALLKHDDDRLDWDVTIRALEFAECWRAACFFAHFFDTHYRDNEQDQDPCLSLHFNQSCWRWEKSLFSKCLLIPLLTCKARDEAPFYAWVKSSLLMIVKLVAMDSLVLLRRFIRLFAVYPKRDELLAWTFDKPDIGLLKKRFVWLWTNLPIYPSLLAGTTLRVAAAVWHVPRLLSQYLPPHISKGKSSNSRDL